MTTSEKLKQTHEYTEAQETPSPVYKTFDPEKMYTYVKGFAAGRGWTDVLKALAFVREKHAKQTRKSGEPYIIHPLTMACHALALGLEEQAIITACLYHDVPEDCDVDWRDLPIDDPVAKNAVRLLTHIKPDPLESYYREIAKDPIASIVKLLDRCDNVSTMAGVFKTPKLMSYIEETRTYNLPLWRTTKDHWPQYSNALFVLKYHILSVINGLDKVVTILTTENGGHTPDA